MGADRAQHGKHRADFPMTMFQPRRPDSASTWLRHAVRRARRRRLGALYRPEGSPERILRAEDLVVLAGDTDDHTRTRAPFRNHMNAMLAPDRCPRPSPETRREASWTCGSPNLTGPANCRRVRQQPAASLSWTSRKSACISPQEPKVCATHILENDDRENTRIFIGGHLPGRPGPKSNGRSSSCALICGPGRAIRTSPPWPPRERGPPAGNAETERVQC